MVFGNTDADCSETNCIVVIVVLNSIIAMPVFVLVLHADFQVKFYARPSELGSLCPESDRREAVPKQTFGTKLAQVQSNRLRP